MSFAASGLSPVPEQQQGAVAYVFGITDNGTPISLTFDVLGVAQTGTTGELDSDDVSYTWEEKQNKDTTGNVQNITKTNFKYERTIKLSPSGATRAAAATSAINMITVDVLVVANYKITVFNGNWRVKPGTKIALKMDENATYDVSCEKYANATQNANLTGTPIVG